MMRYVLAVLALCGMGLWLANSQFHLYERLVMPERFYFVTVRGTQFYLHGEPFRFIGANTRLIHGPERATTEEALRQAKAHGVRVIRQWAVGEAESEDRAVHRPIHRYYFQAGPNRWQEESFVQLDSLLATARDHGLKVIITLLNNWKDYGGIPMYLYWAGHSPDPLADAHHDLFYTDPQIRNWFKAYVKKLVQRRNTVTGIAYRDDPTILAWELANEAEIGPEEPAVLDHWVRQMAAYIKGLDPHHLVSTSFSLYGRKYQRDRIISVNRISEVDFCDIHFYATAPHQQQLFAGERAFEEVLEDITQIAHYVADKPLVIGEAGFPRGETWKGKRREYWFERLFAHSLALGVNGVLVWSYAAPKWQDPFEINWRKKEDAAVCSLMTVYGARFARSAKPASTPHLGLALGDTFRVGLVEQVFERPDHQAVETGDGLAYRIPVDAYTRARWINFGYWDGEKGYASVYAKDDGYFEYGFVTTRPETLRSVYLKVRLSTDYPPGPRADSLGRSDVRIALNERELGRFNVRPQRYFGTVYELTVGHDQGTEFMVLPPGPHRLRFSVDRTAPWRNGMALLGRATQQEYAQGAIPIVLELTRVGAE